VRAARAAAQGRVLAVVLVLLIVAAAAAFVGYRWLAGEFELPGPAGVATRLAVEPGMSVRVVLARLQTQGAVRNARAVGWYLRLQGIRARVQAGNYEIPPHASPAQILELFAQGKVILEELTVVEGASFADFLQGLDAQPHVAHTLTGKSAAEVMSALGHAGQAPEGEFFPDTYRFADGTSDAAILALAYDSMQRAVAQAWAIHSPDLPFDTPYQALILASIVEKEAALKGERARIAGVFVNRLRKGMRLQSDPTVVYGLGVHYDGTIHARDLASDTPYNTYTREGLPPTPIALPGRDSLNAAVQPEKTEALYFVATGLNDGAHQFSATLEEHNAHVQTYLARLRSQQGTHR
jgi:UPF0755 protein